jgi:hypothetical protein
MATGWIGSLSCELNTANMGYVWSNTTFGSPDVVFNSNDIPPTYFNCSYSTPTDYYSIQTSIEYSTPPSSGGYTFIFNTYNFKGIEFEVQLRELTLTPVPDNSGFLNINLLGLNEVVLGSGTTDVVQIDLSNYFENFIISPVSYDYYGNANWYIQAVSYPDKQQTYQATFISKLNSETATTQDYTYTYIINTTLPVNTPNLSLNPITNTLDSSCFTTNPTVMFNLVSQMLFGYIDIITNLTAPPIEGINTKMGAVWLTSQMNNLDVN